MIYLSLCYNLQFYPFLLNTQHLNDEKLLKPPRVVVYFYFNRCLWTEHMSTTSSFEGWAERRVMSLSRVHSDLLKMFLYFRSEYIVVSLDSTATLLLVKLLFQLVAPAYKYPRRTIGYVW